MSEQRKSGTKRIAVAVAQTTLVDDPRDVAGLRATGEQVRKLMRDAAGAARDSCCFPKAPCARRTSGSCRQVPARSVRRTGPGSSGTCCARN